MKFILVFFSAFFSGLCSGQSTEFNMLLDTYFTKNRFNGVVLVADAGKIIYTQGIGFSDRQTGARINSQSKFKIASITKTFTAVLALQLMEEGKLMLNGTIGQYFPEYTGEAKDKVTIEDLITYSSGIPNCESYTGDTVYSVPITIDSFIVKYCSGKPGAAPGNVFGYGNGDYIILGKIIEKLTGKTFKENLKERILKPLRMRNTDMLYRKDEIAGLVQSYTFDDSLKTFHIDKPYYIENFFSAGAIYSTAGDLFKFDQGIFKYKLLKKETVDLMLTPHAKLDNVGLGFWIAEKYGSFNSGFAYRPGGIYGSSANWIHVMNQNRVIIVFGNTDATNLFEMSQQLNSVLNRRSKNIAEFP